MTKEKELLQELKALVLTIDAETDEQTIDDPAEFITQYYQQDEVLLTIRGKLFDYYPPKAVEKNRFVVAIEHLQTVMREREQALVTFYDWGNPVALFMEKAVTFATLKAKLTEMPL